MVQVEISTAPLGDSTASPATQYLVLTTGSCSYFVASAAPFSACSPAYDAFVIGSAAYMFHWLKEATSFAKRHRAMLAERPVWLFSSGPLGTDLVDKEGRDVFEATRPREFTQLQTLLHPRGERVFFGSWDADASAIGIGERFLRLMPKSRAALPVGDFRDWPAIGAWAVEIASELQSGR